MAKSRVVSLVEAAAERTHELTENPSVLVVEPHSGPAEKTSPLLLRVRIERLNHEIYCKWETETVRTSIGNASSDSLS